MVTVDRFQQHCADLVSPNTAPEARKELAADIRDSMEVVHSQDYQSFLANFLPAFRTILSVITTPQRVVNVIHQTRAIVLEILSRLPHNEILRARLLEVFTLSMHILQTDNEDNAVTAIHIIFDLHKNYRHHLGAQVQPFLDFVRRLYESFNTTVDVLLLSKSALLPGQWQQRQMSMSTQSFKVITECPLLVMFVFQLYPKYNESNIILLLPLMVRAIESEVPASSVPPTSRHTYHEFIAAQVKTVSFLAYLLKQNPDYMKADQISIPRSVVKLLQACPGSSVVIRKELLVATRHILGSPFRQGFFDQIDVLLDEIVLVGTGRAATDTLRPLAYSFLAELVHCVRLNLKVPQLEKIIFLFSTNVHDPKFSYTLQTSSIRLLMNLIEGILKVNSGNTSQRAAARELLICILRTIVTKYITIGEQVPRLLKAVEELRASPDASLPGNRPTDTSVRDPLKEVADFKVLLKTLTAGIKTVIWSAMNIRTTEANIASAAASVTNVQPGVSSTGATPNLVGSGNVVSVHKGLGEQECELISKLLGAGQNCFRLFSRMEKANGGPGVPRSTEGGKSDDGQNDKERSSGQSVDGDLHNIDVLQTLPMNNVVCAAPYEEREIFEQFAQIFTVLDVGSFQDVFGLRMGELFEHIVANPEAIMIPQHFLANGNMSKYFSDILLNFLVDNLALLDVPAYEGSDINDVTPRGKKASALLRLFRILFAGVSLFPANEPVLRLHVTTIVRKTLKFAAKAEDPHAYLQMLRAFFKAINGGKHDAQFEVVYRDFCPLVEPLFQGLLALYNAPNNNMHRDLIIELCLIVPARPSTIFPYLELQMMPIIWSLKSDSDNAGFCLRALEFWIDMLIPAYLNDLLNRVEPNIIGLLQNHGRSSDSTVAKYAIRILGKLGPRARSFKTMTTPFAFRSQSETAQKVRISWLGGTEVDLETDKLISLSADALMDARTVNGGKSSLHHKVEAWKFLFSLFIPTLGLDVPTESMGKMELRGICLGAKSSRPHGRDKRKFSRTKYTNAADNNLVMTILPALIATSQLPGLHDAYEKHRGPGETPGSLSDQLTGVCRYFAALAAQEVSLRHHEDRVYVPLEADPDEERSWRSLSPSLFINAVVRVLSLDRSDHMAGGLFCLRIFSKGLVKYCSALIDEKQHLAGKSNVDSNRMDIDRDGSTSSVPPQGSGSSQGDNLPADLSKVPQGATRGGVVPNRGQHQGDRVLARCVAGVVDQLCHSCNQRDWSSKRAGVRGIEAVFDVIPDGFLRSQYFASTQHTIRSLLFVTRGADDSVSTDTIERAKKMMFKMLKFCFLRSDATATAAIMSSKAFKDFIIRLGWELPCDSPCTRQTARECFTVLAETMKVSVSDVLAHAKDQLFSALLQRSIRQNSLAMQIGYVECVNFFLESGKEKFGSDLFTSPLKDNLLMESIFVLDFATFDTVTEAEEGFKYKPPDNRYLTTKNTRLLLILRRKILQLLCNVSVYSSSDLQRPAHERLFRSMISCFFKCLQSGDDEIVQSAKRGLKQAIVKHPKPKELLQQNLRPILVNLGDYKKLSIPYLQSLSRVLELFSHWFNVNLGDKLLEHLHRWTEPGKIGTKGTPGTESRVGAAILDLFHLLPPAAAKFLDQIVPMVVKLEAALPVAGPGLAHLGLKSAVAASTSPYRAPLLRFCNQHAAVASQYFLGNLQHGRMRQLLFVMVRASESTYLRKDFMDNVQRLLAGINFSPDGTDKIPLHLITLIDLLSQHNPEWLKSDPEIIRKLKSYWHQASHVSAVLNQSALSLSRVEEMKSISSIFLTYCSYFSEEVDLLFELLLVFTTRTVCDFSFVKEFLKKAVVKTISNEKKRLIITRFLTLFHDANVGQERKVHALQHIVLPMVSNHLQSRKELPDHSESNDRDGLSDKQGASAPNLVVADSAGGSSVVNSGSGQGAATGPYAAGPASERDSVNSVGYQDDVLDGVIVEKIMREILDQPDDILRFYEEPLSAELLRLSAELIRHMPHELGRYRKELIKFGWGHLKREDSMAKHWAFVNVTTFFEAYQAPIKIILQVYVALLRACQNEGRELVQQALDILTPALPMRLPHKPSDHRFPIWIRYTKKILLEEGHSIGNLIHILQLIVRHYPLFYVARSQFVPIMANALSRIGLSSTSGLESRRLCMNITDVIIKWEQHCRNHDRADLILDGTNRKRGREAAVSSDRPGGNEVATPSSLSATADGQEPPNKTRKSSDGQPIPTSSSPTGSNAATKDADEFVAPRSVLDAIFNFLVQVSFRSADRRESPLILKRCVKLIEEAGSLWSDVTVRFSFIEKVIAAHNADKITHTTSQKNGTNASSEGTPGNDGRGSKIEGLKYDKNDPAARSKRIQGKLSSLLTALVLMSVLTKTLGEKFINDNMEALRAVVVPALTESDAQTAIQCSKLLGELLKHFPIHDSSSAVPTTTGKAADNAPIASVQNAPLAASVLTAANQVSNSEGSGGTSPQQIYALAHQSAEFNLKSLESMRVYCGLVAVRTLSESAPQEFGRHQDLLVKTLLRLTKEHLSAAQMSSHPGPSNNGTTQNPSRTGLADRPTSNSGTQAASAASGDHSHSQGQDANRGIRRALLEKGGSGDYDAHAITLSFSLLGRNISSLESSQRKTFIQLLTSLIDRCVQIPILIEIVNVVQSWVYWTPREDQKAAGITKDPLTPKEKGNFMHRMVVFERLNSPKSEKLMNIYLRLILRVFGGENDKERRPELTSRLERAFMLGLKSENVVLRQRFFKIYNDAVQPSVSVRLNYILGKQDWELLGDSFWIRYADEVLISSSNSAQFLSTDTTCAQFPSLVMKNSSQLMKQDFWKVVQDASLEKFIEDQQSVSARSFINLLQKLLLLDPEVAHVLWVDLFPKLWASLSENDRAVIEKALSSLLTKEYHQIQMYRPRNNVQTILESIVCCKPLPVIDPRLIQHLGSRWHGWHAALVYYEIRKDELHLEASFLKPNQSNLRMNVSIDLEEITDAQVQMFQVLNEQDFVASLWKQRSQSSITRRAISLEQLARYPDAMDVYSAAMNDEINLRTSKIHAQHLGEGSKELKFWEESWINCARNLCQWDVLTEFSRSVMHYELLHECLWRIPEWSGMRELLLKNPVEDGPQLKLYQAYIHMQENKIEVADGIVQQGFQRAADKFCALPHSADIDARMPLLVNFQQLVELEESSAIFTELSTMSGHTTQTINIEQKLESVRIRLNTWRDRLPSIHEPLRVWSDILAWRNHMHAIIFNVFDNLKEAAAGKAAFPPSSQNTVARSPAASATTQQNHTQPSASIVQALPQSVLLMGINETAWNVHRFARASRKQGYPEVALHAMRKLYPFGTLDLAEYFVKTKELTRSFLARPRGLEKSIENGLYELKRCNFEHFSPRQKAQLFTVEAKLLTELGREDEAAEALRRGLNTSSDVGSTWLTWGKHCDKIQVRLASEHNAKGISPEKSIGPDDSTLLSSLRVELAWREAAVNCFLQAVRFGSRGARPYLSRVLRLLTIDINSRLNIEAALQSEDDNDSGKAASKSAETKAGASSSAQSPSRKILSQTKESESDDKVDLASVRWMPNNGVTKTISSLIAEIPTWMWLPWLSQLVNMLARKEGIVVRPLLLRVAHDYPQSLFFLIRSFIEERKGLDKPTKFHFKEALKGGRPLLPPNRSGAALHAAQLIRQIHAAKEQLHRSTQRYSVLKRTMEALDSTLAVCQDPTERTTVLARRSMVKDDIIAAHTVLDKCVQCYKLLQLRHQQLTMASDAPQKDGNAQGGDERHVGGSGDALSWSKGSGEAAGSSSGRKGEGRAESEQVKGDKPGPVNGGQQGGGQDATGSKSRGNRINDGQAILPYEHADLIMTQIIKSHTTLYMDMERMTKELAYRLKPQREEHLLSLMSALLRRCYQSHIKMRRELASSFRTLLHEGSKMCFRTGMEGVEGEQKLPSGVVELKKAFESELAPQTAKDFPKDMESFIERVRRWQNIFQRRVNAFPEHMRLESVSKHLLELRNSDIEVFGQYADVDSAEPVPDKHVKIDQFGAEVKYVYGPSYPCRGLGIIGMDGKIYEFALETSVISGLQAADERAAQVYRLLNNWVFAKEAIGYKRRIRLCVPVLVPTGARTRMASIDGNFSAIGEGLDKYLEENGRDVDDAIMSFRTIASKKLVQNQMKVVKKQFRGEVMQGRDARSEEQGREYWSKSRVEAYNEVCQKHVPDRCLRDWIESKMVGLDEMFMFQKRFSETLGTACVVGYCLGVGARRPNNMLFSWSSGAVSSVNLKLLTSAEGILESGEVVPFRLTRNMSKVMGKIGLEGPVVGSMIATLHTLGRQSDVVQMYLDLILRDELVGWDGGKLQGVRKSAMTDMSGGSEDGEKDKEAVMEKLRREEFLLLEDRLNVSIERIMKRMGVERGQAGDDGDLMQRVCGLINEATKADNLAKMDATWQAWY